MNTLPTSPTSRRTIKNCFMKPDMRSLLGGFIFGLARRAREEGGQTLLAHRARAHCGRVAADPCRLVRQVSKLTSRRYISFPLFFPRPLPPCAAGEAGWGARKDRKSVV